MGMALPWPTSDEESSGAKIKRLESELARLRAERENLVEKIRKLREALEPFARYACEPLNSCNTPVCQNCVAFRALKETEA